MQFDDILIRLGEFGRYQRVQYFFICLTSITCSMQILSSVYVMATPKHRCRLPNWSNDTFNNQSETHRSEIERWIPSKDSCHLFTNSTIDNQTVKVYCGDANGWVFDHTDFVDSFVSQFDLVCNSKAWSDIVSTCYMAGVLVGSLCFGWASDKFGRKPTLIFANFLMFSFGSLTAAVSNTYAIAILKFLTGCTMSGVFPVAFVFGMELAGPNMRFHTGLIIEYTFAVGLILLAGSAYLIRYWRWLQLVISLPNILYLSYIWLIPESPRWLLANNRIEKVQQIVNQMVVINKVTLPVEYLDLKNNMQRENKIKNENIFHLFKTKLFLLRSINIWFQWLVIAMVYYGLSLNTGSLPGSIYLNSLISAIVEIPGYVIAHTMINRFGRRRTHCFSIILGGLACGSTVFLVFFTQPESANWAFISLTMIGKLFVTAAFAIIFLWTAELLPTTVRNVGVSTASMFGRIGTLLAPTIGRLQEYIDSRFGAALPLLIFGAISVGAGIFALFLPESLGQPLTESIEEGEPLRKNTDEIQMSEKLLYETKAT